MDQKITMIIAIAAVGCLCFAGGYFISGGGSNEDNTPVMVSGSTTVQPLMNAWASEYEKVSNAAIYVSGGGSGTGRDNTNTKISNIGMASSVTSSTSYPNLIQHTVAFDAVVIVASSNVTLAGVSINDLKNLFLQTPGVAADNPTLPTNLTPVVREFGSGTRETFVTSLGGVTDTATSNPMKTGAVERTSAGAVLREVNENQNRIGFVNMNSLIHIAGGTDIQFPNVKSLPVGKAGVTPTTTPSGYVAASALTVQEWMSYAPSATDKTGYPMSRALFVLTLADGTGLNAASISFIQWMYSAEAQKIVDDEGFVHLDDTTLKAEWEKVLRWPAV